MNNNNEAFAAWQAAWAKSSGLTSLTPSSTTTTITTTLHPQDNSSNTGNNNFSNSADNNNSFNTGANNNNVTNGGTDQQLWQQPTGSETRETSSSTIPWAPSSASSLTSSANPWMTPSSSLWGSATQPCTTWASSAQPWTPSAFATPWFPSSSSASTPSAPVQASTPMWHGAAAADIASMPAEETTSTPAMEATKTASESHEEIYRKLNASYDVHVVQQDETSPYYSISAFEDLNLDRKILQGLYAKRFDRPSKIQEHALPLLLKDPPQHLVAQAQSGTGKTAAFCLAVLGRLDYTVQAPQAIILSPTRELTLQTVDVMKELARFTPATVSEAVYQINRCYKRVTGQIVIGTPGTVERLIKTRELDVRNVRILVLDEADTMLDMQSLGQQCQQIKRLIPRTAQLVLFSATYPSRLERFIDDFLSGAERNQVRLLRAEELAIRTIHQFYIDCASEEDRFSILCDLYKIMTISKSIIFVHARTAADKITERLIAAGHQVSFLHGALTPEERDQRMDAFRTTRTKVLVSTDVLSRGIDICDVNMVVNYDPPRTMRLSDRKKIADPELYLHRVGRTGRFGRKGVAINFVHSEESYEAFNDIKTHYMCEIHQIPTDWEHLEGVDEADKKNARLDIIETFIKNLLKKS
ncbi:RNA helicase required for poly(A+) mRNA export [Mortierella sp. NVP41]|nr:RNA helicase required for poly(A+) mRNA export [Mortierella sp. NVP41]